MTEANAPHEVELVSPDVLLNAAKRVAGAGRNGSVKEPPKPPPRKRRPSARAATSATPQTAEPARVDVGAPPFVAAPKEPPQVKPHPSLTYDIARAPTARIAVTKERLGVQAERADHLLKQGREADPKLPAVASTATREADLRQLVASVAVPLRSLQEVEPKQRFAVQQMQASLRGICDKVVENPLWIAASHVLSTTRPITADELLKDNTAIRTAGERLDGAQADFMGAKRALEKHQSRRPFIRKTQNLFFGTEQKLSERFDAHAKNVLETKRELDKVKDDQRFFAEANAAEANTIVESRREDARAILAELERPLERAVLERAALQQELSTRTPVGVARDDAPTNEPLSIRQPRAELCPQLKYAELVDDKQRVYLASLKEHPELDTQSLAKGDRIQLAEREGARAFVPMRDSQERTTQAVAAPSRQPTQSRGRSADFER